jgi:divalent metal cation (Fe/Co/Zn/Cd) transporter
MTTTDQTAQRERLRRRGLALAVATIAWNLIEGIVAVTAGIAAGSIALVGFGIDSAIEVASSVIIGPRL